MSLQAAHFFVGISGSATPFFRACGSIIHFQNELKRNLAVTHITLMQQQRHHMTVLGLKLSSLTLILHSAQILEICHTMLL